MYIKRIIRFNKVQIFVVKWQMKYVIINQIPLVYTESNLITAFMDFLRTSGKLLIIIINILSADI